MTQKSKNCNISPRKKKKRERGRLTLEGRILQDLSNLSRVCIQIQKIKSIFLCALICNQFLGDRFILKQSLNGPAFLCKIDMHWEQEPVVYLGNFPPTGWVHLRNSRDSSMSFTAKKLNSQRAGLPWHGKLMILIICLKRERVWN